MWRKLTREALFEPYVALWNLDFPFFRKTENQARNEYIHVIPGTFESHWMSEDGHIVITSVDWNPSKPGGFLTVELLLDADTEKENLPKALVKIEEIGAVAGAGSVRIWLADYMSTRRQGLLNAGFTEIEMVPTTRLSLADFLAPEHPTPAFRIATIRELENEGFDWVPSLYEATREMSDDIPTANDQERISLEAYREIIKEGTLYHYDLMMVALDGARIVAYTRVTPSEAMPEGVHTGLSGTVRSHRRRGLIRALKIRTALELKRRGYEWIQTENNDVNPMYQLNLDLGFKNVFTWIQYERMRNPQRIN